MPLHDLTSAFPETFIAKFALAGEPARLLLGCTSLPEVLPDKVGSPSALAAFSNRGGEK